MLGPCPMDGTRVRRFVNGTAICPKCKHRVTIYTGGDEWCKCKPEPGPEFSEYVVWEGSGINHGWICTKCGKIRQVG